MQQTRNHLLAVTLLLLCPVLTGGQRRPVPNTPQSPAGTTLTKAGSFGAYTDAAGTKHDWQITDAHTLLWDGKPYIPVGGTFAPRSFVREDAAGWDTDLRALEMLKAKGLQDVLIQPGKSLLEVPVPTIQRLLDYLDSNGFHYGIGFGKGLSQPLKGTVIKPATYRYDSRDNLTAQWQVANADKGLFVLADTSNENKIVKAGHLDIREEVVNLPIDAPAGAGRIVALLFPHKALPPTAEGSLPDLWSGFDDYRDRLLTLLSKLKFGPGLRFYSDPLTRQIGLSGEYDYLVPDSPTFALEFEAFLSIRYPNIEELKQNWNLIETDLKGYSDFARLLPLWANDRGVPYFFDSKTEKMYRITDVRQSKWWEDFLRCRNESIQYYMSTMANLLKRQIANVPVVYTWTQTHPIFLNGERDGGMDGLQVIAPAANNSAVTQVLGPAYSLTEQAGKTLWSIATQRPMNASPGAPPARAEATLTANEGPRLAANSPFPSRNALFSDLDKLRRVGYKGFFVDSFQTADAASADWLRTPESLDWLKAYAGSVANEANAARYAPRVLFYPLQNPGPGRTGFVPGEPDVLWLSSFAPGEVLDWWPSYSGYTIRYGENNSETVLLSLQGARKTHLVVPNPKALEIRYPNGAAVPFKIVDKRTIELTIDERPIIFNTASPGMFPQEAAEDTILQLTALYQMAYQQKVPTADAVRNAMDRAKFAYKQKDFETAYTFSRQELDNLTYQAAPYIWLEGEAPYKNQHTFSEVAYNVEASGRRFLRLSTPNPPARQIYGARYVFDVPQDARYNIWVAGTVPGPGTSPIRWRVNTEPEQDPQDLRPRGPLYANDRFGWILLGSATLRKGNDQSLTIYVTDRAQSPAEYLFALDTILITPNAFTPNGTVRPLPVELPQLRSLRKKDADLK